MSRRWKYESLRARVYLRLKSAGAIGLTRLEMLDAMPALTNASHLDNALRTLRIDGHIVQDNKHDNGRRKYGRYSIDPTCIPAPISGLETEQAVTIIADVPAGISEAVLGEELSMNRLAMRAALAPAEQDGRVRRIFMPQSHGGGLGWVAAAQVPGAAAFETATWTSAAALAASFVSGDVRATPQTDMSEPAAEAAPLLSLPVFTCDIDAIHRRRRQEFSCALGCDGKLTITTDAVHIVLDKAQTRELINHLDAHREPLNWPTLQGCAP